MSGEVQTGAPVLGPEERSGAEPAAATAPGRRPWAGLAAVVWVVLLGLASLAPALAHGSKLGAFGVVHSYGIEATPGRSGPYNPVASDQVQQTAPWVALDWTEVHHGHLPLWNPYSAMGTPLLFDFQSAGLSVPALVSYVFPWRFSYDVFVFVKLVIAGTGLLFAARVLRVGWLGAALGASIGELSGAFSGWLGWPMDGVLCWTGWVLGAGLLLARGRRRRLAVPLLAFSLAAAVYGGHPESLVILAVAVTVPVVVALVAGARSGGGRALLARLGTLVGGAAAGAALGAPLLLPGAQLLAGSVHQGRSGYYGFPARTAVNLLFAGWYGYPVRTSQYFGFANYYETAAFVGLAGLALAVLALLRGWRRPGVAGVGLGAVVLGCIVWWQRMALWIDKVPGGKLIIWSRALIPLDLFLGLLAGAGLDVLLRDRAGARATARWYALVALAGAVVLAGFGYHELAHPPGGGAAAIRDRSFGWPAVQAALLLLSAAAAVLATHRRPAGHPRHGRRTPLEHAARAGVALVALSEIGFVLFATPRLWSSSATGFARTPAEQRLAALVGTQRISFDCPDATHFADLGILPEANAAKGIAEAEMYDAILPLHYLTVYARLSHTRPAAPNSGNFCVPVTNAAIGRDYGIAYVLTAAGGPAIPGARRAGTIGGEQVWHVPGASVVSIQPVGAPLDDRSATAVPLSERDPARLTLHLHPATTSRLEVHLGAFPGWSARIDGRPLHLRSLFGDELQAVVPAGAHTVVLRYQPKRFVEGTWLAIAALVALAAVAGLQLLSRRRPRREAIVLPAALAGPAGGSQDAGGGATRPYGASAADGGDGRAPATPAPPAGRGGRSRRRSVSSPPTRAWRNRQTRQV